MPHLRIDLDCVGTVLKLVLLRVIQVILNILANGELATGSGWFGDAAVPNTEVLGD